MGTLTLLKFNYQKSMPSGKKSGNNEIAVTIFIHSDFCNGKSLEIGTNQATNQADQGANQVRNMKIEILNAIYENSKIMQEQIAKKLNVKISSIKYYMEKMKKTCKIERIGTSQNGEWIILK